jgi:tocopherol cyclase
MINFHGRYRSRSYFEGWYFKHQSDTNEIAFIPGVNFTEQGEKKAFIQVITGDESFQEDYPYSTFKVSRHKPVIRIGESIFSHRGLKINMNGKDFTCSGTIKYPSLTPLKSDIMGPFRFVPFMECNHGVISMKHHLEGALTLNGKKMDFADGNGYIEKDWGSSFPQNYLWLQCNRFTDPSCSIMVSIAKIPFAGFHFQGCICAVTFQGKEYRLATYNGVKIIRYSQNELVLRQGKYCLQAEMRSDSPQQLLAPRLGGMTRRIRENMSCPARFRFYCAEKLLFDLQSEDAGYEFVK